MELWSCSGCFWVVRMIWLCPCVLREQWAPLEALGWTLCVPFITSPKIHRVSTFSLPSLTFQPLLLLLAYYLLYRSHSFNLYLPSTDESYYPLTPSIPSRSLTSPCTFAFSGLYKPCRLYSHLHFLFLLCNFLLHLCICVYFPFTALSVYLYPSSSFFSTFPLIGRQMLTLAY